MDLERMLSQNGTAASKINMIILKEPNMTGTDKDAGFCSGGDEDDLEGEENVNSPTDGSEDSIEVKVSPIFQRNKRKCVEPRKKSGAHEDPMHPLKKRIRLEAKCNSPKPATSPAMEVQKTTKLSSHFRPWSISSSPDTPSRIQTVPHDKSSSAQEEPLSLVKTETVSLDENPIALKTCSASPPSPHHARLSSASAASSATVSPAVAHIDPTRFLHQLHHQESSLSLRVPPHPAVRPMSSSELIASNMVPTACTFKRSSLPSTSPSVQHHRDVSSSPTVESGMLTTASTTSACGNSSFSSRKEQRNYKNMTRERRIEANARERTRVHTISAAFDTLRRAVPAYSHNQKLSKLSVLRIACSYILTLSRVVGDDYSADKSEPSLMSCVDSVTRTIQTEGKLRKKKDE